MKRKDMIAFLNERAFQANDEACNCDGGPDRETKEGVRLAERARNLRERAAKYREIAEYLHALNF